MLMYLLAMNTDTDLRTGRRRAACPACTIAIHHRLHASTGTAGQRPLHGTVVLWRTWPPLAPTPWPRWSTASSLHPDAEVIIRQLPAEAALLSEFQTAVQSGLGADLILTGSDAVEYPGRQRRHPPTRRPGQQPTYGPIPGIGAHDPAL